MLRLTAAFLAIVAFSFCVALPYSIFHDGGVLYSSGFQLVLKSFGMVLMGATGHSTGRHFLEKIGNDVRLLNTALCTRQAFVWEAHQWQRVDPAVWSRVPLACIMVLWVLHFS